MASSNKRATPFETQYQEFLAQIKGVGKVIKEFGVKTKRGMQARKRVEDAKQSISARLGGRNAKNYPLKITHPQIANKGA